LKPQISEFSYGYAVTEEMVAHLGCRIIAPKFPSLYEEGKDGGGYDVEIPTSGTPVFLQFKLSDYLENKNAKEYRDHLLTLPYYRMHLWPLKHSRQHKLLLKLEKSNEHVYYIAPEFYAPEDLNRYYAHRSMVENSAAFKPSAIGVLPDDNEHYVVFKKGSTHGWRCSESRLKVARTALVDQLRLLSSERRAFGDTGLLELVNDMLSTIGMGHITNSGAFRATRTGVIKPQEASVAESNFEAPAMGDVERIASQTSLLDFSGYIARTYFSSELFIVANEKS
jgi:hypothetical protein